MSDLSGQSEVKRRHRLDADDRDDVPLDGPILTEGDKEEKKVHKDETVVILGPPVNNVVLVTHILIFLYSCCYWMHLETFRYLAKKLGVDPVVYGYLQTTLFVVRLASGPLFGRYGDLFGGRAALTLAFSSAALSYGIIGVADSISMFSLASLPLVFQHGWQGGFMIVTDVVESKERATAFGKLSLSYGVGMVVGRLSGKLITTYFNEQCAALTACGGSLLCVLMVQLFIPHQTKKTSIHLQQQNQEKSAWQVFDIAKILSLLRKPRATFLLLVKTGTGIPIGIFPGRISRGAIDIIQLTADQNALFMAYDHILMVLVRGLGTGIVVKRFGESNTLKYATCLLAAAYFFLSFVSSVPQLFLVMFPMTVGCSLKKVVITSSLTRTVSDADTGAMLGLNIALSSLILSISPTVGGIMLAKLGVSSIGYLGFVMSFIVVVVLVLRDNGQADHVREQDITVNSSGINDAHDS